jgi:protease-4
MGGFFKMFFASLLALIIFSVIGFFIFLVLIAGLTKAEKPLVEKNSVLVSISGNHSRSKSWKTR